MVLKQLVSLEDGDGSILGRRTCSAQDGPARPRMDPAHGGFKLATAEMNRQREITRQQRFCLMMDTGRSLGPDPCGP